MQKKQSHHIIRDEAINNLPEMTRLFFPRPLNSFSTKEMIRFEEFVRSPYHNKHEEIRLFPGVKEQR